MTKKKMLLSVIFLMVFSSFSLQASDTQMDIRLRVFEGIRKGMSEPPRFVTSSYLRSTVTASIQTDFELEKEKEQIKRVFNLQNVNLLTEADLKLGAEGKSSVSHFFRLNGKEFASFIRLLGWKNKGQFLILVNEVIDDKHKNVLTTEITLLGGNIAVFGFEDRGGNPYFLSFHITGPEDKVLPPPPPPPPARKKIKMEIKDFEKDAVRAVGEIKPPKLIKKVDPVYPEEARKAGIDGVVILNVRTDEYGRVDHVRVLKGEHDLLNKAAIEAVKQWIYEPFIKEGKPRKIVFTVTVRFKLNGKDKKKGPDEVKPPKLIKKVDPVYPEEARKAGVEGTVILSVTTDTKGNVTHLKVLESPDPLLSEVAVNAVKQWKYEAFYSKGKPCPIDFIVSVRFKLNGGDKRKK